MEEHPVHHMAPLIHSSRPDGAEHPGPVSCPRWVDEVVAAHPRLSGDDASRLRLAVDLSRENILLGTGGPFGAVVVDDATGEILAAGVNGVERVASSLAHAEMVALAGAEERVGSWSLAGPGRYVLYSSCAPCAMCLGAILWSGVPRVVYAAQREDAEAIGFDEGPVFPATLDYLRDRGVTVEPGPLREEAAAVLRLYAERGGLVYNSF
jgi:tRNA(Arg) A34 adenosine deaminase TadA